MVTEVLQQAFAAQGHGGVEFVVDDVERLVDAGFASGAESVDKSAADVSASWRRGRLLSAHPVPERMPPSKWTSISLPTSATISGQRTNR